MRSSAKRALLAGLLAAAARLLGSADAGVTPVLLQAQNVATSVWDTDPSKVGVQLQIANTGTTGAENVLVKTVVVRGGAYSGPSPLPIGLGTIAPSGSVLLDLVIAVPLADGRQYLMTVAGTYSSSGRSYPFSLDRAVTPSAAVPGPFIGQNGVSGKGSSQPAIPVQSPPAAQTAPLGPNATTPMMIPIGPPRQLSPPGPGDTGPATKQR
jgi:hypothetical protein